MIKIPQPAMVLNAADVPGRYTMRVTYDVDPSEPADVFMRQVRQAALRQPGGVLEYLVIHGHGLYNGTTCQATGGYGIRLGQGLYKKNVGVFRLLRESHAKSKPLVKHIVITSCGAAAVSKLNSQGEGDGEVFCKRIVEESGATVIASKIRQVTMTGQHNFGTISDMEGMVLQFAYNPPRVIWRHDYGRTFLQDVVHGCN